MRRALRRGLFAAVTLLAVLVAVEVVLRLLVSPSDRSYGRLFGRELPPVDLIPYDTEPAPSDRDAPYEDLVVDGRTISIGDLWGFYRDDPLIGYVPRENRVSRNGWWQSNGLGARKRTDVPYETAAGGKRMLVFGDSYAQASRVPQEESWPYLLETDGLETVNFGVDGYGVAQSYLRYGQVGGRLRHDMALLLFAPLKDLWRDVNTIRSLAKDWDYYAVLPRFVLEGDRLVLVRSPYANPSEIYAADGPAVSERLRSHLERYDRFYFASEFREPGPLGRLVLGKLVSRAWLVWQKRKLYARLDPGSEAMRVSRRIFEAFARDAGENGARFLLVCLPSHEDLRRLRRAGSRDRDWSGIVRASCGGSPYACLDLAPGLLALPEETIDRGYGGSHFGPRANREIARLIRAWLEDQGLLGPEPGGSSPRGT